MKFASSKTVRIFICLVVILVMMVSKRSSYILRKKFLRYFYPRCSHISGTRSKWIFETTNHRTGWKMVDTLEWWEHNARFIAKYVYDIGRSSVSMVTLPSERGTRLWWEARFAIKIDMCYLYLYLHTRR